MPPRPKELLPYRIAVYTAFGLICSLLFFQLIRSVVNDLYGTSRAPTAAAATPTACLEDLDRLYVQLSARAVQPSPRGLDQGLLAHEWDQWSRRWEADVEGLSRRCGLESPREPALIQLASALEALEGLRRELSRSGEESAIEAARVRESLGAARALLGIH